MPKLTGLDIPKLGESTAHDLSGLAAPGGADFEDRYRLTIDLVIVIDLFLELRWNLLKTPLSNDEINVSEIFNAESHASIMAKLVSTE